jgi:hypothetical protein
MRPLALTWLAALLIAGCAGPNATSQSSPSTPTSVAVTPASTTPTPAPVLATPGAPSLEKGSFKFTKIAGGLQSPVYVTDAGDGSGRLFIVEQVGRIRIVKAGVLLRTPFLDIRSLVASLASGSERGLLSVAFDPQFKTNGVFVIDYTRTSSTPADVGDPPGDRLYLDKPYVSIRWESGGPWVLAEWKAWANSTEYRAAHEEILGVIREHHAPRFLIDARNARVVSEQDQEWINTNWIPEPWRPVAAGRPSSCPHAPWSRPSWRTSTGIPPAARLLSGTSTPSTRRGPGSPR